MLSVRVFVALHPRRYLSHPRDLRGLSVSALDSFFLSHFPHFHSTFDFQPPPSLPTLSPLPATFTRFPASVANKRLTRTLNPLDATFTRNLGRANSAKRSTGQWLCVTTDDFPRDRKSTRLNSSHVSIS